MNKKTIIAIVVSLIIVAVAGVVIFLVLNNSPKNVVNDFVKACKSEEKMEKFVDKNVDYRALYVLFNTDDDDVLKDFSKAYKDVDSSKYKDEDFVKEVKELYNLFVSEMSDVKVKEIGKTEKWEECEDIDAVKVTLESEDDEEEFTFLFYKGKLIGMEELFFLYAMSNIDLSSYDYSYDDDDYDFDYDYDDDDYDFDFDFDLDD